MSDTPTTIERVGDTALRIAWGDGHVSIYPWRVLRAQCPCAVCRPYEALGTPVQAAPQAVSPDVRPTAINPVGRYAIHLVWSDGHATGIYAFDYLRQLCPCEACAPQQMDEG